VDDRQSARSDPADPGRSDVNPLLEPSDIGPVDEEVMTLGVEHVGDVVVVTVGGEIDLVTAARLNDTLGAALAARPRALVIDLDRVQFFTSVGLTALALAQRTAGERGVDLRVVAATRIVLRPLQITGMADDLAIHPTRTDALAAVGAGGQAAAAAQRAD
jgi:anti-sigma B factor antagonist